MNRRGAWATLQGVVRPPASHRQMHPLPAAESTASVEEWQGQPVVRVLEPDGTTRETVSDSACKLGVAGNLATGAYLAALALEYQAELRSADMDFAASRGCGGGIRWIRASAADVGRGLCCARAGIRRWPVCGP